MVITIQKLLLQENIQQQNELYYSMNDDKNSELLAKYTEMVARQDKVIFGGRLGMYKYFDMHQVIEEALKVAEKEL